MTLRQRHLAGEKTFLDWAGKTLRWTNPESGDDQPAFLFVAVLGTSDYVFAEAFADQKLDAWIEAHIHMAEFYGGVTRLWVPDNAKTGVVKPCYYEPQIHDSYQELADHYGTAVLPTRTHAPRDKAKVENAVLHAERRILARLRDQTFFSLGAINIAILQCLKGAQRPAFSEDGRIAPQALPRIGPTRLAATAVPSLSAGRVAICQGQHRLPCAGRLALLLGALSAHAATARGAAGRAHRRAFPQRTSRRHPPAQPDQGGFTTDPAHRPKAHEKHLDWSPGRLVSWAGTVGVQCAQAVTRILDSKPHPEQGYRACLGIMRLAKGYGPERMEAACRRALALDAVTYPSIASILKTKLDQQPLPEKEEETPSITVHDNIRGEAYYQTREVVQDPGS